MRVRVGNVSLSLHAMAEAVQTGQARPPWAVIERMLLCKEKKTV